MVQFNLLPNVKLEYLKTERTKRLVYGVSGLVSLVAILTTVGMLGLTSLQKSHLNSVAADIKKQGALINNHPDLNQILTIQNQISTLETLHQQEPATDRLGGYLNQIVPVAANISSLNIDFNAKTVTLQGSADSLATVNQLVDTLKFAKYTVKGVSGSTPAFSQVLLTNYGLNQTQATYSISFNFDSTLFDNTKTVTLVIPNQITTRSQLDQPTQLFKLTTTNGGNG